MSSAMRAGGFARAAAVSAALGLIACGGGGKKNAPKTGVDGLEASVEFTAIVEGRVTDGVSGEPLEGIRVELSDLGLATGDAEDEDAGTDADAGADAGEESEGEEKGLTHRSTTTDAEGHFQLSVNTPGSHTLVRHGRAKNGKTYARVRSTVYVDPRETLPESADGHYVIGITADTTLYPKNGTLRGVVFGDNHRDIIEGARVIFRYTSGGIADSTLPVMATTDDEGRFEVEGVPTGLNFNVQVRPMDRDDDGLLDTSNYSRNVMVYEDATTEEFLGPIGALNSPRLLWHNVDSMRTFPREPEFLFVYSHAMDDSTSSTEVVLQDSDDGNSQIPTVEEWRADGFELQVRPASPLQPGHNYRILVRAWSQEPNQISVGYLNFRTEGGADDDPTPAEPVLLNDPENIGFYQTNFRIGLEPMQDVENFRVYARTSTDGEWIWVDTHTPTGALPFEQVNVSLSGAELSDITGGSSSVFSHGGPLYLAAAAVYGGRPGPLSPALEVERTQCFTVEVAVGTNNTPTVYADNRDGDSTKPLVIQLRTSGREWLPQDADATLSFQSSSLVTDPLDLDDFERVRVNPWTIEWRSRLPVDVDAQFLEYAVDVEGLTDVNDNDLCGETPSLEGLVPTRGDNLDRRWHFESDAQGWTTTGEWERGLASTTEPAAVYCDGDPDCDSENYFGTALDAVRADATTSVLSTPTFRTPQSSPVLRFWRYLELYVGDRLDVVFVNEEGDDVATQSINFSTTWGEGVLGLPSDTVGHVEFRFEAADSTGLATEAGVFIDDATITGTTGRDEFCSDVTSCPN